MKRHLVYLLSIVMLISVVCCGDSVEQGETSLVTITIGGSGQRASAGDAITPAAIPSNVATISFTFSASDMDTITKDVNVSGQDEITETFEIPNGNSRRIVVEAKDSSGSTLYRGEKTVNLDGTAVELTITMTSVGPGPSAPSNVSAAAGDGQVTIRWDSVAGATSYNIYWATSSGVTPSNGTKISGITSTTYTHTGLTNGTAYYYVVTAENTSGESSASNEVTATPTAPWARSYGGFSGDITPTVQQTTDGGYIVTGYTISFGSGKSDVWVLKLRNDGTIEWEKTYGGSEDDQGYVIRQTSDGGYVVAGRTGSFDSGGADVWVLKLDGNGAITWEKRYGDPDQNAWEWAYSIEQTSDGGYIFAAVTESLGVAGGYDYWVVKLNSDGTIDWQKTYGRAGWDLLGSMKQTSDGGYIVVGSTLVGLDNDDIWVLKLDSSGDITWQKRYGGSHNEAVFYPDSIQQTSDGGYIIVAQTNSFGAGNNDFWVVRLSSDGTISWQKTYGGAEWDYPRSIMVTSDGGYIVSGQSNSFDAGDSDFWILKLRNDGTIEWQKTYGGTATDGFPSIQETSDGGYIAAGETESFGAGGIDFWVLKLKSDGSVSNLGVDTNITGSDTSVSGVDTSATPGITTESPQDTSATVTDTAAVVDVQAP